jgi:hypothetical protein
MSPVLTPQSDDGTRMASARQSGEWRYAYACSAMRCLSRSIASVETGATSFRMAR